MKRVLVVTAAGAIAFAAMSLAVAQSGSESSGQKTLAATMDVYVFPTEGQSSEQQSKDEAECYNWAVGQTGNDPFDLNKQAQQQQQQAQQAEQDAQQVGKGAGASGAVKGAAAGGLVGAIASDDAGKWAAYGAAAGAISGRRRGQQAQQQATQQAQQQGQQTQQATAEQIENFKKAFAVCLEAKDYMAKF